MNSDIFLVTAYAVPGAFVMIVLLACVLYESVSRRFEVNTYKDVVILFMSAFAPVVNIIMLGALIIVFGLSVMKNVDLSKKLHPTEKKKMKIKYVKGNLLEAPEKFILHGCNMQGVMGSGVAKLIKEKYPSAFIAYKLAIDGGMALGTVSWAEQEDGKLIMNGLTQQYYGREPGKVYVSYEALRSVIAEVDWFAKMHREHNKIPEGYIMAVAMPKIGAGLGGGDWDIISEIIEGESKSFQPVVYEL